MAKCKHKTNGKFVKQTSIVKRDLITQFRQRRHFNVDLYKNVPERRMVDFKYFGKVFDEGCKSCGEHFLFKDIVSERILGLCSVLKFNCSKCHSETQISTSGVSQQTTSSGSERFPYTVNIKAALGMIHAGIGHSHVTGFLSSLGIPAMHHKSLKRMERLIGSHIESTARDSCLEASKLERQQAIQTPLPDVHNECMTSSNDRDQISFEEALAMLENVEEDPVDDRFSWTHDGDGSTLQDTAYKHHTTPVDNRMCTSCISDPVDDRFSWTHDGDGSTLQDTAYKHHTSPVDNRMCTSSISDPVDDRFSWTHDGDGSTLQDTAYRHHISPVDNRMCTSSISDPVDDRFSWTHDGDGSTLQDTAYKHHTSPVDNRMCTSSISDPVDDRFSWTHDGDGSTLQDTAYRHHTSPVDNRMCTSSISDPVDDRFSWTHDGDGSTLQDMPCKKSSIGDAADRPHETPGNVVDITVSQDAAWSKRGRAMNSLSGWGHVIGANTRKCLNFSTREKNCATCKFYNREKRIPPTHDCRKNWTKSSKSMESDIAVTLHSQAKDVGLKYSAVIGDEDSSSIKHIREKVNPDIIKFSDLGHIKRTLRGKCDNIQKSNKSLTIKVRDSFLKNFCFAVRQNIDNSEEDMRTALKAVVPHMYGQHELCTSWCKIKERKAKKHSNLPYGRDLTDNDLRSHLDNIVSPYIANCRRLMTHGSTQLNESLNNVAWSKAPKSRNYNASESFDYRCAAAVLQYNDGVEYINKVITKSNLTPQRATKDYTTAVDKRRMYLKSYKQERSAKRRRKELKQRRLFGDNVSEVKEGVSYKSGCLAEDEIDLDTFEIPDATEAPVVTDELRY